MDKVDGFLMDHYSLSPADVDFLTSYDLKFRASNEEVND